MEEIHPKDPAEAQRRKSSESDADGWLGAIGPDVARLTQKLRAEGPAVPVNAPHGRLRRTKGASPWRVLFRVVKALFAIAAVGVVAIAGLIAWAVYDAPLDRVTAASPAPSIAIEAADGTPLGHRGGFKAADVALAGFPPQLVAAVISIEDRRFYSHSGIDLAGIARAVTDNLAAGHVVEGASTITQQLARNMLGDDERTLRRKLREALVAMSLELRLGKDEILHRYLNAVYLGEGAIGMPAAAQLYFNKPVGQLTLAESAMLAGLIQTPSGRNPIVDLNGAQARAAVVLDAMVANHAIDAAAASVAKAAPAVPVTIAKQPQGSGEWFADWVAADAKNFAGSAGGPLRVRTTLVPALQTLAEQAVQTVIARSGKTARASQAAVVVMRPDGAVVAMVGGTNYQQSQFNRAAQATRQPGSSFKLFLYLAALRAGWTVNSPIEDAPISVTDPVTHKVWSPDNYGDTYHGTVTLAYAFANSMNTAAVRLIQAVGPDQVIKAARDLGIDAPLAPVPSLALGTSEVTLVDMTAAYAAVMSGTMPVQPWGISGVGAAGKNALLLTAGSPVEKAAPLDHRAELVSLLQGVVQHGTGAGARLPGFAAGKTGTTQDSRDAWFIGFDQSLVVGVWVGNDDHSPMNNVTGGTLPAQIWKTFMTSAAPLEAGLAQSPAPSPAVPAATPQAAVTSGVACDIAACTAAYQSFQPADCTFQPYGSAPRQLCTRGNPTFGAAPAAATVALQPNLPPLPPAVTPALPTAPAAPIPFTGGTPNAAPPVPAATTPAPPAAAPGACDVQACAATYQSFRASDCTFQPYDGSPRQLCTPGAGAAAAIAAQPYPPPPVAAPPATLPQLPSEPSQPAPPYPPAAIPDATGVPQSLLDWLAAQPNPNR